MHSTLKRVGCFVLVLVLMFMIFAQPLAPKAEAAVIELTAGAFSSILMFLGMIGITFLTVEAAKAAVNAFVESEPDILEGSMGDWLKGEWGDEPDPPGGNRPPNLWLDGSATAFVAELLNKLRGFFGGKESVEVPGKNYDYNGIPILSTVTGISPEGLYNAAPYDSYDTVTFKSIGGQDNTFTVGPYNSTYYEGLVLLINGSRACISSGYGELGAQQPPDINKLIGARFGFYSLDINGSTYINPFIVVKFQRIADTTYFYTPLAYQQFLKYGSVLVNPLEFSQGNVNVPYKNKSPYTLPNIRDGIINKITTSPGPIVIDKTQVIDAIETDNDEKLQEETDQKKLIDLIPGLKDILEDIRDNQPGPEADFVPPELPGGDLSEKFPFCVPFDLFRIVKALNAPPVAPKWEIPVIFASVEYEDKITLDLGQFETLAIPIRWGLTLMYLLGLIVVSRKMIKG